MPSAVLQVHVCVSENLRAEWREKSGELTEETRRFTHQRLHHWLRRQLNFYTGINLFERCKDYDLAHNRQTKLLTIYPILSLTTRSLQVEINRRFNFYEASVRSRPIDPHPTGKSLCLKTTLLYSTCKTAHFSDLKIQEAEYVVNWVLGPSHGSTVMHWKIYHFRWQFPADDRFLKGRHVGNTSFCDSCDGSWIYCSRVFWIIKTRKWNESRTN